MCCTHNGHAGYSLNGHAGYSLYFLPVGGWVCIHNGHAGYSLNFFKTDLSPEVQAGTNIPGSVCVCVWGGGGGGGNT